MRIVTLVKNEDVKTSSGQLLAAYVILTKFAPQTFGKQLHTPACIYCLYSYVLLNS